MHVYNVAVSTVCLVLWANQTASAQVGACCLDVTDGLTPYETCQDSAESDCEGFFFGQITCSEPQAYCFPFSTPAYCDVIDPFCCIGSGGAPIGPGSVCDGQCQVCGGFVGLPCDQGEFCKLHEGTCNYADIFGICTEIAQACPAVYDPVCGCDGMTYGNECEAEMAGVSIDHRGACPPACEPTPDGSGCVNIACFSAIPEVQCVGTVLHLDIATGAITTRECECMDFNQCHVEFGDATPFPVGNCPLGETCEVFGSDTDNDGIDDTFTARCVRSGACCLDISDGPIPYETCVDSEEGDCAGIFTERTICTEPQACCLPFGTESYCDVIDRFCCSASGGVPQGPGTTCGIEPVDCQVCGGFAGLPCDAGEFCKFPDGTCKFADIFGICTEMLPACPEIYDPVCGCDGVTYDNECFADAAGVSIDHRGECGAICGGLGPHPPCGEDEFCKLPIGQCCCDQQGVCTEIPSGCLAVWDPVCGCDGMTYGNECEADAVGVAIDYPGECIPCPYGDVIGFGVVDIDDILCILIGFANPVLCPNGDIAPCGGDGMIDIDDILAALAAFAGEALCPCTP